MVGAGCCIEVLLAGSVSTNRHLQSAGSPSLKPYHSLSDLDFVNRDAGQTFRVTQDWVKAQTSAFKISCTSFPK